MTNSRNHILLSLLERDGGWMTASALAQELGCSPRTVKTAVSRINDRFPGAVRSGAKGYCLGDPQVLEVMARGGAAADVPQSAAERKSYILRKLLMQHHVVDLYQLANELCISPTTLDNELAAIKAELAPYNLALRVRGGRLCVEGDVANEKKMVSDLIYSETKDFFNQLEFMGNYFPDIDLKGLREDINAVLTAHGLSMNGYSLSNLILHVAISLERELNGFRAAEVAPAASDAADLDTRVPAAVEDMCRQTHERYGVEFAESDRRTFAVILAASVIDRRSAAAERLVDVNAAELVAIICDRVREAFSIDLSGDDFKLRFSLHIENMLKRDRFETVLRNPQLSTIKNDYPFIYDISVFVADVIHDETGVRLSEDEISFIALHIGCLIEEQGEQASKLRALLVCPSAESSASRLIERIDRSFGASLAVVRVLEEADDLRESMIELAPIDLVIATQHLRGRVGTQVVEVSPFFTERDTQLVGDRVDAIRRARFRATMDKNLHEFFRSDLFFTDLGTSDRDGVIERLADTMVERGFAYEGFKQDLFDREAISSSAYRSVAIPHPLNMDARRTAVAVSLHPGGLTWNGSTVEIVIMLAIKKQDAALYRDLFEFVTTVLAKAGCVKALARAQSFEEFVGLMLDFAQER